MQNVAIKIWTSVFLGPDNRDYNRTLWVKKLEVPAEVVQPFDPWPQLRYKFFQWRSLPTYGKLSGVIGLNPIQGFPIFSHFISGNKYFVWSSNFCAISCFSTSVGRKIPTKSAKPANRIRPFSKGDIWKFKSPDW